MIPIRNPRLGGTVDERMKALLIFTFMIFLFTHITFLYLQLYELQTIRKELQELRIINGR